MSLTYDDLQQIRQMMHEELAPINGKLGKLEAIEDDIKEIYKMLKPLNSELAERISDHEARITALESQTA